ncbi:BolA family protein [Parendozoicomonas haliclonae]|uniref:Transcriptional regulator BolA n=1 Tax=Parendozoicomonas haliclonae TaxID=1960125 RepID=A0A1X7AFV1_9GAMM|nr:BolA family protein [Parendozoicomonas haliclonae]SMA37188.1 transcriptional regulator BolA [Parendozoicomonas haliclonae]
MHASEVKTLLESKIEGAEVFVEGEGCDFRLTVVSTVFAGCLPVKRQQIVYTHLNEMIAAGTIHAVTMQTFTPEEWAARQG